MIATDDAAHKLAGVFPELNAKDLKKKLNREATFVWIKRNLTPQEQHAVNNLGIPGLYFQPEQKRVYPHGNLFSHVLGYVDRDNKGLAGVEQYFNKRLNDTRNYREPLNLSLDVRLQQIARTSLGDAIQTYNALGGTAVVLDVRTNEVLAMCSLPDFNPHDAGRASDDSKFNRAALGVYEMGSTFKTFTTAMALDYGIVSMRDGYDATNPIKVSRFTISDTHPKKRWLSVPEIYAYSSNIGTVKMVLDVGVTRQKEFLKRLGLFQAVKIELPEAAKPLLPSQWREINAVTISYGHGLSVTPLSLAQATSAVVNGGFLRPLTVLKDGNIRTAETQRVLSENTARQMRRLMRMVVQHGTGNRADVAGYRVGGKTGTAEKVQAGGRYNASAKQALFIGAFPVDDPKYLVLVMVDEPKGNKSTYGYATGGWIAAPVAANIIRRMAPMYGMRPIFDVIPENAADRPWVEQAEQRFLQDVKY